MSGGHSFGRRDPQQGSKWRSRWAASAGKFSDRDFLFYWLCISKPTLLGPFCPDLGRPGPDLGQKKTVGLKLRFWAFLSLADHPPNFGGIILRLKHFSLTFEFFVFVAQMSLEGWLNFHKGCNFHPQARSLRKLQTWTSTSPKTSPASLSSSGGPPLQKLNRLPISVTCGNFSPLNKSSVISGKILYPKAISLEKKLDIWKLFELRDQRFGVLYGLRFRNGCGVIGVA